MSRLTALSKDSAVDTDGLAAFNFRDMDGWHLLMRLPAAPRRRS